MKHTNKSKKLTAGMLGTACLISLFSGVAMADANVSMKDTNDSEYTKVELNKTYKRDKDISYFSFIPEETGAYLLDTTDFHDEWDTPATVYSTKDQECLVLFTKGDDAYGVFEKGNEYILSVGTSEEEPYEFTLKKADFGASLSEYHSINYGEKITFKPSVIGKGAKFEWYDPDEKLIGKDKEITIQPDRDSCVAYTCKITFENGESSLMYFFIQVEFDLEGTIIRKGANDNVVNPNETFELELLTVGSYKAPFTYQWFKNDEAIKGATGKTLKTSADQASTYKCEITDDKGNNFVYYYQISIENGYFFAECESVSAKKGSDATLKVNIHNEGANGLTIEWQDLEGNVVGTGDTFTIKNIQKTQEFIVYVKDKYGRDESFDVRAIVENHLKIEEEPSTYKYIGDETSVELKVNVTADEMDGMEYHWYIYDEDYKSVSVADTPSVQVSDIKSDIHAECKVVDKYGTEETAYFMIYTGEDPDAKVQPFVNRCYEYILGRKYADSYYWTNALVKRQLSGAEVVRGFLNSPEFVDANVADDKYIDILYKTILDRDCDADGKAYWMSQLSSGTLDRMTVANGFFDSQEWIDLCTQYDIRSGSTKDNKVMEPSEKTNAFVERLYTKALGREFDEEGKKYWANELANFRISGEQVALAFFMSEEFINSNLNDDEFVNRLYNTFMDRTADPEGYYYWINALASSEQTREDAVYGFARSSEFQRICEDSLIKAYFE